MSLLEKTLVVSKQQRMHELAQQVSRQIFMADDPEEALDMVGRVEPDLVVYDETVSPGHVRRLCSLDPAAPVVVLASGDAQAFEQAGAMACLKPETAAKRLPRLAADLRPASPPEAEAICDPTFFPDALAARLGIVGRSAAAQDELRMIRLVAHSRCNPVLIVGETGTGKELAARAVHALRHPGRPFVAINCAALTATLLESELFGHVKGSFTGADRDKTGLFELAEDGTLFLDEVSEMPQDLQAKLLRVLQERSFRKVGGTRDLTCHATIVASSNRNLKEEVEEQSFRRDLYYRLSVCPINLAPLRSPRRRDDIPVLARYFAQHATICPNKVGRVTSLTKLATDALCRHDWPGNVRELRNAIDRAVLLETTDKIGLSSIVLDPDDISQPAAPGLSEEVKDFSLAHAERELIARALKETGWQKTQAASLLGITRATLYAKVKQYCIEREDHGVTPPSRQAVAV